MRYYVPRLGYGPLLLPQRGVEDKLGGLPWGLPVGLWPSCSGCGRPLTHLAQFVHHPERLDLGATGRVLTLFWCENLPVACMQSACIISEGDQLGPDITSPPVSGLHEEIEGRVVGWEEMDDGVTHEEYPNFFDQNWFDRMAVDLDDRIPDVTKLGGTPCWIQSPSLAPPPPWRFALQLDSSMEFEGKAPTADQTGLVIMRGAGAPNQIAEKPRHRLPDPWNRCIYLEEGGWSVDFGLFGEYGTAYVFVRTDRERPEAMMVIDSL